MTKLTPEASGFALAVLIAFIALPVPGQAKTPDGTPPAEEDVCDSLRGGTPGLYGLCVAFCEAHDAELSVPDGDPAELARPDRKLLENYDRKRTASDPPMPCLVEPPADDGPTGSDPAADSCPCWTAVELEEMLPPTANFDYRNENACRSSSSTTLLENYEGGSAGGPAFRLDVVAFEGCGVWKSADFTGGPEAGYGYGTPEQEAACRTTLVNHARKYSVPGVVWDCFDTQ